MAKITLNPLQARTLALLQELAKIPEVSTAFEDSGEVMITSFPRPHGDHMHIGQFTVTARDASGFSNKSVWVALERKGLAKSNFPFSITLTREGLAHDTGLGQALQHSDH